MTIKLNSFGGGGAIKLAPDLNHPSTIEATTTALTRIDGINAVGALTEVLSLTGKYSIGLMALAQLSVETITVKLTVDGIVIWNDTFTSLTALPLFGALSNEPTTPFVCESSLLLELQTTADSSVQFNYIVRPVL